MVINVKLLIKKVWRLDRKHAFDRDLFPRRRDTHLQRFQQALTIVRSSAVESLGNEGTHCTQRHRTVRPAGHRGGRSRRASAFG